MKFNDRQVAAISHYFADISKILVLSTVVGFFVPARDITVTVTIFIVGAIIALFAFVASILILR